MRNSVGKISSQYKLASAIGAGFMWGGWAFWVNHTADNQHGYVAGIIQGVASFFITMLMVELLSFFSVRVPPSSRFVLPPVLTVSVTGSALFIIHWLAKTPSIVTTIAAPLLMAFCFSIFTTYRFRNL